jgi:hypothetical protein
MSKSNSDPLAEHAIERARQVAHSLGLLWHGHGGAQREQLNDGTPVWRVFDDWGHIGGYAILDAVSGDLISIAETPLESRGDPPPLPDRLAPSDEELFAFVQSKLVAIGWTQLTELAAERVPQRAAWRITARTPDGAALVDVGGRRGNLSIARAERSVARGG